MLLRVPEWYQRFHCIAGACPDNCCIGWEIDIDPDSDRRYRRISGPFGEQLNRSIQREGDQPCFRLAGDRCAMLNEENLCELILRLGEESLCQICRDHPRFTETFGALRETGVGLCCPEAGRLLLSDARTARFSLQELSEEPDEGECDPALLDLLLDEREALFHIAQDRTRSVPERMRLLLDYGVRLQAALEQEPVPDYAPMNRDPAVNVLKNWMEALSELEPINGVWTETLARAQTCFAEPPEMWTSLWNQFRNRAESWSYEYEHLLIYYLFRYFLKAVYMGDCLTPVQFAVLSCLLTGALELSEYADRGELPPERRIALAGLYSKQIEYSEENLETVREWLIFEDAFAYDRFGRLLDAIC